jgi:activator of HSP90 ATPase
MPYEFTLTVKLSATPREVYDAWLSSEAHTAMTGGVAHINPTVSGAFDAWDGYITGKTLELDPGRRILQTWRTRHFAPNDPDSTIEVVLAPERDSTLLTLKHSNVPDGQTSYEESGWRQYYFEPMKRRFEWLRLKATL